MNAKDILTDDVFDDIESGPDREAVAEGKYKLRILGEGSVQTDKSGNRSFTVALAPVETEDGVSVNGKAIYHRLPMEGTFMGKEKETGNLVERQRAAAFFAPFFRKGLGLSREDTIAVLDSALAAPISQGRGKETTAAILTIANGEQLLLEGKTLMGRVVVEDYEGKSYNKVKSVWEPKEA